MRLIISFLSLFILCEIHGKEENEKFLCAKAGRYENPKDETCNSFFLCSYTLEGELIQTQYSCPEKSVFSPETALCSKNYTCPRLFRSTRDVVQIENVNNVHYQCTNKIENDFKCRRSGKYADLIGTSCRRYFLCSLLRSGEYMKISYDCPEGSLFDPRTQRCHINYRCPCQMNSPNKGNSKSYLHRRGERREHIRWFVNSKQAEIQEKWTQSYKWSRIPPGKTTPESSSTSWPGPDDCLDAGNANLFKCYDEGLYPDKKDVTCTDYFLCKRLPNGGFLRMKYSCPYGSIFNPHSKNCSMQYSCPCQLATSSTYSAKSMPSFTTHKPTTTSKMIYTTEFKPKNLECEIPQKEFRCERTGRFPDKTDLSCNTYFFCEIDSSSGELRKKTYRCPRCLTFSPELEKCTDNYICPCSGTEAPRMTSSSTMSPQTTEHSSETDRTNRNGSTRPYPTQPGSSEFTTENISSRTKPTESSASNDCSISVTNKPFKCQSKGRFPDKNDLSCSSYFICSERKNGSFVRTKDKCPKNFQFDPTVEKCSKNYECPCSRTSTRTTNYSSSTSSRTASSGRTRNKSTATTEQTKTSFPVSPTTSNERRRSSTPESTKKNGTTKSGSSSQSTSEYTTTAGSSSTQKESDCIIAPTNVTFQCISKGRFPDRRDSTCSSYFLCSSLGNGSFIKTKYKCPKNSYFNPSLNRCSKSYRCPCANVPSTTGEPSKITSSQASLKSTTIYPTDKTTKQEASTEKTTEGTKLSTMKYSTIPSKSSGESITSSVTDETTDQNRFSKSSQEYFTTSKSSGRTKTSTYSKSTDIISTTHSERTESTEKTSSEASTESSTEQSVSSTSRNVSSTKLTFESTVGSTATTQRQVHSSTQKSSATPDDCIISPYNEPFKCTSKGRFPDRRDSICSSYFLCSALNNGTLIRTQYNCPKNSYFDPQIHKCSKLYECPCTKTSSKTTKHATLTPLISTEQTKVNNMTVKPTEETAHTKSSRPKSTIIRSTAQMELSTDSTPTEISSTVNSKKTESTKVTSSRTNKKSSSGSPTLSTSAQSNEPESTSENSGSSSSQHNSSSELTTEKENGSGSATKKPATSSTENGSQTTSGCIIPAYNKPFKCLSKGRFADLRDLTCSSYFLCSALKNGALIRTKYKCPKKSYFDPTIRRCNKSYQCPCSTATSPTIKITSSATTPQAIASKTTRTPTDNSTITGKTKTSSRSTTSASISKITESTGAISSRIPKNVSSERPTISTSRQTKRSESTVRSSTSQSDTTSHRTSEKTKGSKATTEKADILSTKSSGETTDGCIIPSSNEPFRCSSKGRFPNRKDLTCSTYFLCSALNNGTLLRTKYNCPKKSFFDPLIQKCSKSYECPCTKTTSTASKYSSITSSPTEQTSASNTTEQHTETSHTKSSQKQSTITGTTRQTKPSTPSKSTASSDRTKTTKITSSSLSSTTVGLTLSTYDGQSNHSKAPTSLSPSSQKLSSTTTEESKQKTTTEQNRTTSSTTPKGTRNPDACIIPPSNEVFRCTSKGRFPDKRDLACSTYFLCSALNDGSLIRTKYKCPRKSYFDPLIHKCSKAYKCPCSTTTITPSTYSTSNTSRTSRQLPYSSSKKPSNSTGTSESTITTGRGSAITESTRPSETTDKSISDATRSSEDTSSSSSSRPSSSKGTSSESNSEESESTYAISTSKKKSSSSTGQTTRSMTEQTFSSSAATKGSSSSNGGSIPSRCITQPSNEPFECRAKGRFPNEKDLTCSSYFLCSTVERGIFIKTKHQCPRNSYFNPSVKRCSRSYECPCLNVPSITPKPGSGTTNPSSSTSTESAEFSTGNGETTSKQASTTKSLTEKTKPSFVSKSTVFSTTSSSKTEETEITSSSMSTGSISSSAKTGITSCKSNTDVSSTTQTSKKPNSTTEQAETSDTTNDSSKYSSTPRKTVKPASSSSENTSKPSITTEKNKPTKHTTNSGRSEKTTGTESVRLTSTISPRSESTEVTSSNGSTGSTSFTRKKSTPSKSELTESTNVESTTEQQSSLSTHMNTTSQNCVFPPSNKYFECSSVGRFPNRKDLTCSSYFLCSPVKGNILIKTKHQCPRKSYFDPSVRRCSRTYECPCSYTPTTRPISPSSSSGEINYSTGISDSTVSPIQTTSTSSSTGKTEPSVSSKSSKSSTLASRWTEFSATSSRGIRTTSAPTETPDSEYTNTTSEQSNSSIITTERSISTTTSVSTSVNSSTVFSTTTEKSSSQSSKITRLPSEATRKTLSTKRTTTSRNSTGMTETSSSTPRSIYTTFSGKSGSTEETTSIEGNGSSLFTQLTHSISLKPVSTGAPTSFTKNSTGSVYTSVPLSSSSTDKERNTPRTCIIPQPNKPFKCSSKGRFPNTEDLTCASYFLCASIEGDIFIKTKHECPKNLQFDPVARRCSKTYQCPCWNTPSTTTNAETSRHSSHSSTEANNYSTKMDENTSSQKQTTATRTGEKTKSSSGSNSSTSPTPVSCQSESSAPTSRGSLSTPTPSKKENSSSESTNLTTEQTISSMFTTEGSKSGPTSVTTSSEGDDSTTSTRTKHSTSSKSESSVIPTSPSKEPTRSESTTVQQISLSTDIGGRTSTNCIIPPTNKPFKCSSEGRFPNERDRTCSSYFLCASIEGDLLIRTKHKCPINSFFDPSVRRCSGTYECPCVNMPSTTPNSKTSRFPTSSSSGSNNHSTETNLSTISPKQTTTANSSSGKTKSSSSSNSSTSPMPVSRQTESTAWSSESSRSTSYSGRTENSSSESESTKLTSEQPNISMFTTKRSSSSSKISSKVTSSTTENSSSTKKIKPTKQVPTTESSIGTRAKSSASDSTEDITTSGQRDGSTTSSGLTRSNSESTILPTRWTEESTSYESTTEKENSSSTQIGGNTTANCIIQPSNQPFKCSSKGRFPNRKDLTCSSYILCSLIEGDIFIKTKHECPRNSYFDPSAKICSETYECPCSNIHPTTSSITESSKQSQDPSLSTDKSRTSFSYMSSKGILTTLSEKTESIHAHSSKASTSRSTEITSSKSAPTARPEMSTTLLSTESRSTNDQQDSSSTQKASSAGDDCIIPARNEPFRCLSKGRFPDKRDLTCSAYFLCSALNNGTLIKTAYNCPRNSYFDPAIHRCSREYDCPCSHKTITSEISSTTTPQSTRPSLFTSSGEITNRGKTTNEMKSSTDNTENVTQLTVSSSQRVSQNSESTGSECVSPPSNYTFVCNSKGRFSDIRDQTCSSYYLCSLLSDGTFVQAKYRCTSGSKFDPFSQNCSAYYECPCSIATTTAVTSKVSTLSTLIPDICQPAGREFVCASVGRFPKPGDVSCCTYYSCSKSDNGTIIQTEFSCPEGTSFDPVFKTCSKSYQCPCHITESPQYFTTSSKNCVIPTEDFVCSSAGRFPNWQDVSCCNYFLCSDIGNGTFIKTEFNCPMGKSFDPELRRCSSSYVCPCRITESPGTSVTTLSTTVKSTTAGRITQPPECDLSPENPDHICTVRGRFKDSKDITCTNYFLCSKLKNGTFIRTRYTCPRFSFFDPSIGLCTTTYKCPCINIFSTPSRSTGRITKIPGTRAPWHINTRKTTQTPAARECVPLKPAISELACSAEGKFLNPLDTKCTSYIHCVRRASVLVKTVVNCEGMTAFDITLKKCTANAICKICTG